MRLALWAAAILVFSSIAAAPAAANIIPQRGMFGITLKMSLYDVEDQLGRPDSVGYPRNYIGGGRWRVLIYGRTRFVANYDHEQRLVEITTTSLQERTADGVGVGSTERAVLRTVRGVKCRSFEYSGRVCYLGGSRPGATTTDFFIGKKGRVKRVSIGLILD